MPPAWEALTAGSSRPKSVAPVLGAAELGRLRAVLHQPPRAFGHARSAWTLALLAEVAQPRRAGPSQERRLPVAPSPRPSPTPARGRGGRRRGPQRYRARPQSFL